MLKRVMPKRRRIFRLTPSVQGDGSTKVVEVESTRARVVQPRVERARPRVPAFVRGT